MGGRTPSNRESYRRAVTWDGLVAGALGGLALVAFFLVLDGFQGTPLRTPAALASAVFGVAPEVVGVAHVAGVVVVQLAVFALMGAGAVWLFRMTRTPENALLGAVYGLLVFTLLFYLSLDLSGVAVLEVPDWPWVLLGNLLAGAVMGGYLHRVGPLPGHGGGARFVRDHPVLREGGITGLLGAGVVAIWFLAVDLVLGEPFRTAAVLGSMLFLGAEGPADVVLSPGTVGGYTAIHLVAFLVLGVVLAGSATGMERYPGLVSAIVLFFVFLGFAFVAVTIVMGTWVLDEVVGRVLVGNLLATAVMGGYVWRVHPLLREEVRSGTIWRDL